LVGKRIARPHPGLLPPGEGESFGIIRLFFAHPPIQPWVYPEALGAFYLLLGPEEKAGMRAG
jgi:hypothetical protein